MTRISPRVACVVHALLEQSREMNSPVTAAEVLVYDWQALSAQGTGAALREARKAGLAVFTGRYWIPTNAALDRRREFEDVSLALEEADMDH